MNRRQISFVLAAASVLGGVQGCGSTANSRSGYLTTPRPAVSPPCASCGFPSPQPPPHNPPPAPILPGPNPPPGGVVPPPSAAEIQQNAYAPPPGVSAPPAPAAIAPGVTLEAPEPAEPEPARPLPNDPAPPQNATRPYPPPAPNYPAPPSNGTRPQPPQTAEPPKDPVVPPARDDSTASPALPVDIPQFAVAKPDVASGQEPFADGVNWLKAHGYRTVLHIRAAGEDDSAARRSFEQAGLRYLSLEVSPQTLSKEIVDRFNGLVADANNLPLFVYDKDSSLAGGLWYLHFRLADKETDEKAREDAARLGFQQEAKGPYGTMWIAVQNYLSKMKP